MSAPMTDERLAELRNDYLSAGPDTIAEMVDEIDRLCAEVSALKAVHIRGCECSGDDACLFARERDKARAELAIERERLTGECELRGKQIRQASDALAEAHRRREQTSIEMDRQREQLRLTSIDRATIEASENEAHATCNTLRAEVVRLLTEINTHYNEVNRLTVYWKHHFDRQVEVNATLRARVAELEAERDTWQRKGGVLELLHSANDRVVALEILGDCQTSDLRNALASQDVLIARNAAIEAALSDLYNAVSGHPTDWETDHIEDATVNHALAVARAALAADGGA